MDNIPFFSLSRQWEKHKAKIKPAIESILESQQYIGGKAISDFESKIAKFINTNHVISCNSGTDALWLALKALKLQADELVLTTPFSFIASSSEIKAHGAHPIFIDIEKDTYNISPTLLEAWLNENAEMINGKAVHSTSKKTIAGILAVNMFGQVANFKELRNIADRWGLWIVEDAAQSIGSHIDGKQSGTFGDIATFSFYPTKNMGAFGDAGCATTSNPDLASRLLMLRNHGRYQKYDYVDYGINSRMDAIQAAVLTEKLDIIESLNARRREIAKIYQEEFSNLDHITLPKEKNGYHIYHQFSIQTPYRDALMAHLASNGIGSVIFYPKAFHEIPFLQTEGFEPSCPVAESITKTVMSLPIWPELTNDEVMRICNTVKEFNIVTHTKQSTVSL